MIILSGDHAGLIREPRTPAPIQNRSLVRYLFACVLLDILFIPPVFMNFRWRQIANGQVDFLMFYAGARLAGHAEQLYSLEANRQVQQEDAGALVDGVRYNRPPFYAALLKPLAWLPFRSAYLSFQLLSIMFFLGFVTLHLKETLPVAPAAILFTPFLLSLVQGQDLALMLLLTAASLALVRSGRHFAAGAILSLCAAKFHLFIFLPFLLVRYRRWRMCLGAISGCLLWVFISFLVAGPRWPKQYFSLLADPMQNPQPGFMPTLRGLAFAFHLGVTAEAFLIVLVVLLYIRVLVRSHAFETAYGLALITAILVAPHAYIQDCTLLLFPVVTMLKTGVSAASKLLALSILSPIPYALFLVGPPLSAVVPILLFVTLCLHAFLPPVGEHASVPPLVPVTPPTPAN